MLLPLPLSPTRATISRRAMVKLTSSTAWSLFLDRNVPNPKCMVSPSTSSSAPQSGPSPSGGEIGADGMVSPAAGRPPVPSLVIARADRPARLVVVPAAGSW